MIYRAEIEKDKRWYRPGLYWVTFDYHRTSWGPFTTYQQALAFARSKYVPVFYKGKEVEYKRPFVKKITWTRLFVRFITRSKKGEH